MWPISDIKQMVDSPAVTDSLHSRTLRRTAELLGGTEELRRQLQVPAGNLSAWLAGIEQMPTALFLKTVDLLVAATQAAALENRPQPVPGEQQGVQRIAPHAS